MNIVTIPLGLSVGCKAVYDKFPDLPDRVPSSCWACWPSCCPPAGGVLLGDLMYIPDQGKVNPLIGSAGVSAVPMAARVSQTVGQKENPSNFLLMHAMGPNVAGVIGSAVAAGILINIFS